MNLEVTPVKVLLFQFPKGRDSSRQQAVGRVCFCFHKDCPIGAFGKRPLRTT